MRKTFAEELEIACKKLKSNSMRSELERVHREATRDKQHAFRNVDMPGPKPWERRTDITI